MAKAIIGKRIALYYKYKKHGRLFYVFYLVDDYDRFPDTK